MRSANLALKFLLELAALAALAYVGATAFDGAFAVAAAVVFPVAMVVVWGRWCAPRAARRAPMPGRAVLELTVFGVAAVGLWLVGAPVPAAVFAGVAALNAALLTRWHQWAD